jgi:hypothetical protein
MDKDKVVQDCLKIVEQAATRIAVSPGIRNSEVRSLVGDLFDLIREFGEREKEQQSEEQHETDRRRLIREEMAVTAEERVSDQWNRWTIEYREEDSGSWYSAEREGPEFDRNTYFERASLDQLEKLCRVFNGWDRV